MYLWVTNHIGDAFLSLFTGTEYTGEQNKSCCAQEIYALVMEDGYIVWYQVMVDALKKRKAEME